MKPDGNHQDPASVLQQLRHGAQSLIWLVRRGRVISIPRPDRGSRLGMLTRDLAAVDADDRGFSEKVCFHNQSGVAACCNVVVLDEGRGASATVLLSERDDSIGIPLMNAIEMVASMVYNQRLRHIAPGRVRWLVRFYPRPPGFLGSVNAVYMDYSLRQHRFLRPDFFRLSPPAE